MTAGAGAEDMAARCQQPSASALVLSPRRNTGRGGRRGVRCVPPAVWAMTIFLLLALSQVRPPATRYWCGPRGAARGAHAQEAGQQRTGRTLLAKCRCPQAHADCSPLLALCPCTLRRRARPSRVAPRKTCVARVAARHSQQAAASRVRLMIVSRGHRSAGRYRAPLHAVRCCAAELPVSSAPRHASLPSPLPPGAALWLGGMRRAQPAASAWPPAPRPSLPTAPAPAAIPGV